MTGVRWLVSAGLVAALIATAGPGSAAPQSSLPAAGAQSPVAHLIDQAYTAAYSLDHDQAIALARQAVAQGPDDPDAHRAVASIVWLNILFRRGAVTIDHYLGGVTKSLGSLPKPPPELVDEFHRELETSIRLSEAKLEKSPRDIEARYGLGSAYGLEASYEAAVEGSTFAAFRSAKKAYDAAETVLASDPHKFEAAIIVGTYRYVVATLGLPSRWMAYVAGFGGGKEKGIALIETALNNHDSHVDAATALVLIYSREGRYEDVLRLLRELETEFPRNRLFVLERGATAIRAGRADEAETVLTAGLAQLEQDTRPKIPGEHALWLYKRGAARNLLHRSTDAQSDLRAALDLQPVEWVRGRIHLELGKSEDLQGRRPEAVAEYRQARTIAETINDPIGLAEAGRLERRPFGRDGKP